MSYRKESSKTSGADHPSNVGFPRGQRLLTLETMDPASAERAMLRVFRSGLDVPELQHQVLPRYAPL